jgi:hypothetical protein
VSRQAPARRSSSSPTVMQRLARSWTRWRQSLRAKRAARLQAKWERRLGPPLMAMLVPVAAAMQRLDQTQRQQTQLLDRLTALLERPATVPPPHPEILDLLTEVLQTLQPPPEQALWEAATSMPLSSPPSSPS